MRKQIRLLAIAVYAAGVSASASASQNPRFLVPGNDGYGIADCLAEGAGCGQAVADAYCEAQGFKAGAESFGLVEDVTASTTSKARSVRPAAFEIACRI